MELGIFIHKGLFSGPWYAQINASWQRKNTIDDSPTNLLPVGYIEGYKTAADMLLEQLYPDDPRLDLLVYPIFFLYRQFVELLLKKVYENHHTSDEQLKMIKFCGHNIMRIFSMQNDVIYRIVYENVAYDYRNRLDADPDSLKKAANENFDAFRRCLEEITIYDQGSFAFRYYSNRDLSETITQPLTIDLGLLKSFIDTVSTYFYQEYAM